MYLSIYLSISLSLHNIYIYICICIYIYIYIYIYICIYTYFFQMLLDEEANELRDETGALVIRLEVETKATWPDPHKVSLCATLRREPMGFGGAHRYWTDTCLSLKTNRGRERPMGGPLKTLVGIRSHHESIATTRDNTVPEKAIHT